MPGGGNPDYSVVATWEAASDNDLAAYTGPVVLDCYDSQDHSTSAQILLGGATNTSATAHREIRSSANCANPWTGKKGTGANFFNTGATGCVFLSSEGYVVLVDLYGKITSNSTSGYFAFSFEGVANRAINCVAGDCTNIGTGVSGGFRLLYANNLLCYNCIALGCDGTGFYSYDFGSGDVMAFISCTALGNNKGFDPTDSGPVHIAFSCYAANNASGDFKETLWDAPSGWNASKDNTADLGGAAGDNYKNGVDLITAGKMGSDGIALAADLFANGNAGDRYGRNPYNDLSGTYDFGDFLKNDADGETISKKDISGIDRPTPDTADCSWNVGASELATTVTTLAPTTQEPTTLAPTTLAPTTLAATTQAPTTLPSTTLAPSTLAPSTQAPSTLAPTTLLITTEGPTTSPPTTVVVTTLSPTTIFPTTLAPTSLAPTTLAPTTLEPTTEEPTTVVPTTVIPTTLVPSTLAPTTVIPTTLPSTTLVPSTLVSTTLSPTTKAPTTPAPTTGISTTVLPTTLAPTTLLPTTLGPTTLPPTTLFHSTVPPTTLVPTTQFPICPTYKDSIISDQLLINSIIQDSLIANSLINDAVYAHSLMC